MGDLVRHALWWLFRLFVPLRYRIRVRGLEHLNGLSPPILLLPNHPGLIDPVLVLTTFYGRLRPRAVLFEGNFPEPIRSGLVWLLRAVAVPDLSRPTPEAHQRTQLAIDQIVEGLRRGDNFVLWPSGRAQRDGVERLGSARGLTDILREVPEATVVRLRTRRLRAEEIRDSILQVNGSLRLDRMYGPSIYPVIPEAVLAGQSRPGENWHTSSPEERSRRSIYVHLKRSLQVPMLAAFDAPDPDSSCPVRFSTTQPTQALGMLNSDFLNEQADIFARSLRQSVGDDQSRFIELALWRTCQRPPTNEDVRRGAALIESLKKDHGQTQAEAEKNFCLLALNLNEFMYLD